MNSAAAHSAEKGLRGIEVVEDRTSSSSCSQGFLRLRRLLIRNLYDDGSASAEYPCDIVTRPSADAVAICLYNVTPPPPAQPPQPAPAEDAPGAGRRRVWVLLKESPRAPVYFRKDRPLVLPDPRPQLTVVELVAGLIEASDGAAGGLERRAAAESWEEAGQVVSAERIERLGAGSFASPGISDEKVYFCAARLDGDKVAADSTAARPSGDGSTMEEATRPVIFELREAIRACRLGGIPDLKTEVGLWRLADRIGYLPQLDLFVHELPFEWRRCADALGLDPLAAADVTP